MEDKENTDAQFTQNGKEVKPQFATPEAFSPDTACNSKIWRGLVAKFKLNETKNQVTCGESAAADFNNVQSQPLKSFKNSGV